MKTSIALIAAVLVMQTASADSWTSTCTYWAISGSAYDGPCTITSSTGADGAYAETVKAGDFTVQLVETGRQGIWSTYTIDGKPGVRFEHNREWLSYSTLALDMTLEVGTGE